MVSSGVTKPADDRFAGVRVTRMVRSSSVSSAPGLRVTSLRPADGIEPSDHRLPFSTWVSPGWPRTGPAGGVAEALPLVGAVEVTGDGGRVVTGRAGGEVAVATSLGAGCAGAEVTGAAAGG